MLVLGSVDIAAPVWGPVSIFSGREESEPFFLQESHNLKKQTKKPFGFSVSFRLWDISNFKDLPFLP